MASRPPVLLLLGPNSNAKANSHNSTLSFQTHDLDQSQNTHINRSTVETQIKQRTEWTLTEKNRQTNQKPSIASKTHHNEPHPHLPLHPPILPSHIPHLHHPQLLLPPHIIPHIPLPLPLQPPYHPIPTGLGTPHPLSLSPPHIAILRLHIHAEILRRGNHHVGAAPR